MSGTTAHIVEPAPPSPLARLHRGGLCEERCASRCPACCRGAGRLLVPLPAAGAAGCGQRSSGGCGVAAVRLGGGVVHAVWHGGGRGDGRRRSLRRTGMLLGWAGGVRWMSADGALARSWSGYCICCARRLASPRALPTHAALAPSCPPAPSACRAHPWARRRRQQGRHPPPCCRRAQGHALAACAGSCGCSTAPATAEGSSHGLQFACRTARSVCRSMLSWGSLPSLEADGSPTPGGPRRRVQQQPAAAGLRAGSARSKYTACAAAYVHCQPLPRTAAMVH